MLRLIVAAALVIVTVGAAVCQTAGVPQLQEPKGDKTQMGVLADGKPFTLATDQEKGSIDVGFNDKMEAEELEARVGVIFASDNLTLNADHFTYNNATGELQASGKRVIIRQGDMIATCQLFKYASKDMKSELIGNPIVYNRTSDGKQQALTADVILLTTVNGRTKMSMRGGSKAPTLSSSGMAPSPVTSSQPARIMVDEKGGVSGGAPAAAKPADGPIPAAGAGLGTVFSAAPGAAKDQPKAPASKNKIDPNNPEDLQSLAPGKN